MNNFDFIKFFNENDINYKTSGKNIGGSWVGIDTCPRCQAENYHAAVNLKTGAVNCWKCSGINLLDFIKLIKRCSYYKAKEELAKYQLEPEEILKKIELEESENEEEHQNTKLILPKSFTSVLPQIAKDYLKKRRCSYLEMQKKYDVMFSGEYGRASWRVVWPVYMDNKLVNWIGRDVSESPRALPYIFELDELAVIKRAGLIFNYDKIKVGGSCILNEGVFSACRVNGVGLLSVNFTKQQVIALKRKKIKNAYLMLDNDQPGETATKRLESILTSVVDNLHHIEYDAEDPDLLSDDEARELKRLII